MNYSVIGLILFFSFVTFCLLQLIFYWVFFSRLAFYKKKAVAAHHEPVSIVICAKNEFENLKKNLPLILTQKYTEFEVVIVNDCSEDDTKYLLDELAKTHSHLKIVTLHKNVNFFHGKKFPLSIGIKSAKYDLLLLTDADCKPTGDQWLASMQSAYTPGKEVVLGYGPYETRPSFLNSIIRFDTIHVALQYFSYALSGIPYMGVGRNLSYRKSLFYKNKGFIDHYTMHSGDDDLFVNQVAKKNNVNIEISPESMMFSAPKSTYNTWHIQKKRHLTSGKLYKTKHKFLLGLYSVSQLFFWLLLIPTIFFNLSNQLILILIGSAFLLRMGSWLTIFKLTMNKLNEKNLLLISPILEIILIFLIPLIAFSNLFSKSTKWK